MAAEKCPVKRFALASLFHCSNCYKMQCFNEKFKLSIPMLSFLICCVWVCWGCLWEVILLKFLLKHAFCSFIIAAFYSIWSYMSLLKVQLMKFACCINKSALLCSFCILTDNLMIVKHHTWLCIHKDDVNLPFVLLSRLYLTVMIYHVCPFFFRCFFFLLQHCVYGCCTQAGLHSPMEQSGPIQLGSQLHRPVSGIKAPWPWHWSGHWALGSSQWSPPQPGLQWHSPFTQMPLLEHVGSRQSTVLNKRCTIWKDNPF